MSPRRNTRRSRLAPPLPLEDRLTPADFTATIDPRVDNDGAVAEIVGFFNAANNNGVNDTVTLFKGGRYVFNEQNTIQDGGTALPVFTEVLTFDVPDPTPDNPDQTKQVFQGTSLTLNGNDARFVRPAGAPSFRFLRAAGGQNTNPPIIFSAVVEGPVLGVNNLTFEGGNTFDLSGPNLTDPTSLPDLSGGAIRIDNANLFAKNVQFLRNTTSDNGGAVAILGNNPQLFFGDFGSSFSNAMFDDNYAGNKGGAVYGSQTDLFTVDGVTFTDATFTNNISLTGGGAVHGDTLGVSLLRSRVATNRGFTGGVFASQVRGTEVLFKGNLGTGPDGNAAAVIASGSQLTLERSTITENVGSAVGTVVGQATGRAVELINTTVSNNTGAGAAVQAPIGQVVLTFATVTDNRGTGGATGGVSVDKNILTIFGSVVANNRSGNPLSPNVDVFTGQVRNDGFNLLGVAPASFPTGPTDRVGVAGQSLDPRLGPVAENGGLLVGSNVNGTDTRVVLTTRLPAADSPLLDRAGTPEASRLTVDSRGRTRPNLTGASGTADIGAAELQPGETPPAAVAPIPQEPPLPVRTRETFTAVVDPGLDPVGALNELVRLFGLAANNQAQDDVINLFPNGRYEFNNAFDPANGGTALPRYADKLGLLTVNGNGATFFRPQGAPSFRFFRAIGDKLSGQGPAVTINNMTFDGGNTFELNSVNEFGVNLLDGGALRFDDSNLFANDVTFRRNTSAGNGGAVGFSASAPYFLTAVFTRTTFDANFAGGRGGAVYDVELGGAFSPVGVGFVDSTLTGNKAVAGAGAFHGDTARVTFANSDVLANQGTTGGVFASTITGTSTLFRGNIGTGADEGSAGAISTSTNTLTLINSTIAENTSPAGSVVGQGLGRAVELLNTTVHLNTGGGPAVSAPAGEVVVSFSTITNNRATQGAVAGVQAAKNVLTLFSSVVAGNRVVNPLSPNVDISAGLIRNDGFNLIGVAPVEYPRLPGTIELVGSPGNELDPRLSKLDDYGGPVPTRPPAADSPLRNAAQRPQADRISTDARGFARVVGDQADIGAFEVRAEDVIGPAEPPLPPLNPLPPPPPPPPPPPVVGPNNVIAVGPGGPVATVLPPTVAPITVGRSTGGPATSPPPTSPIAVSSPNTAALYDTDGQVVLTVTPFDAPIPGGVRTATGDFTGDGTADLLVATGPGASNLVRLFDGVTGKLVSEFAPFEAGFTGGLFISVGDVNGDRRPDLAVSPDVGGGPRVRILTGSNLATLVDFFGIEDTNFRGGVRSAIADFTGDGLGDLVVAAGIGGGPRIAIWDGASLNSGTLSFDRRAVPDFFLMDTALRNGLFVSAGDVNGDGRADLVVGAGPDGGPRVLVLSGQPLIDNQGEQVPLGDFFTGDAARRDGVPVSVADLDGDGRADVIAGGGQTGAVTVYLGQNIRPGVLVNPDLNFTPFPDFNGGVFVG